MKRYTIYTKWDGSGGLCVATFDTFAEVLSYIQAVNDINFETADLEVKIIDREKKADVYDGPLNDIILAGLRYNYEKGLM